MKRKKRACKIVEFTTAPISRKHKQQENIFVL